MRLSVSVLALVPAIALAQAAPPAASVDPANVDIWSVVYTTDGDVIKGVIVEHVPGQTLRMTLPGGGAIRIDAAKIQRIATEPNPRRAGGHALPPPAPVPTPGPAQPEARDATTPLEWPFPLTPRQEASLRKAGCACDEQDVLIARRLAERGFTANDFVQAYVGVQRVGGDRREVEAMAAYTYLRLPPDAYDRFRRTRVSLTSYYNSRLGGVGMKVTGWIMTGVGLANLAVGVLYLNMGDPCEGRDDGTTYGSSYTYYESCDSNWEVVTYTSLVVGGALTAVGLPLAIAGSARTARRAPAGLLDSGTVSGMERYRLRADAADPEADRGVAAGTAAPPRIGLAPLLGPEAGGLAATVRF